MLILLEGRDCAGKSTLAGRLIDRLRRAEPDATVSYRHCGVPQDHPLDEYVEPLLTYRPGTDQHVVCDRWHVGEYVYPRVTGRSTDLTEDVRAYVELFLRSRGALLVYCDASDDRLMSCGVARGDDVDELVRITATGNVFREYVAQRTLLPLVTVDVSDPDRPDYDATVDVLLDAAARHEQLTSPLATFTTYVGPPRPSLLLVGDRRGTPRHDLDDFGDWPAFAPYPGTSGSYLLTALTLDELRVPDHGVQLRDVALVNANDVDDVRDVWDVVGRPSVVGLGVQARRTLRARNVPHRAVPHPQWHRRFHHHERDVYRGQLLNVASAVVA